MHLVMKSGELWVIAMPQHIKCHCTLLPSELYLGGACILTEFANIVTFLFVTMQLPLKIWMVELFSILLFCKGISILLCAKENCVSLQILWWTMYI